MTRRRWSAAGYLAIAACLALAGCSQSGAGSPSSSSSSAKPPPSTSATQPTDQMVSMVASCSSQPISEIFAEMATDPSVSVVTGSVRGTGGTKVIDQGGPMVTFTEVSIDVDRVISGSIRPGEQLGYVLGGNNTTAGGQLQSGWATSGEFFGTVRTANGTPIFNSLPLIDGNVVFSPASCFDPGPLGPAMKRASITVFSGVSTNHTGDYPTVPLTVLEPLFNQ